MGGPGLCQVFSTGGCEKSRHLNTNPKFSTANPPLADKNARWDGPEGGAGWATLTPHKGASVFWFRMQNLGILAVLASWRRRALGSGLDNAIVGRVVTGVVKAFVDGDPFGPGNTPRRGPAGFVRKCRVEGEQPALVPCDPLGESHGGAEIPLLADEDGHLVPLLKGRR